MFRALVLGAVQGLTEFIPVSSSAHLVLVPFILGWGTALGSDISFDVAVHLGTLLAVLVYFRSDLWAIVRGVARTLGGHGRDADREMARLGGFLAIGTIPAGIVGIVLEKQVEGLFESPGIAAAMLLVTAALLTGAELLYRRKPSGRREVDGVGLRDTIAIGVMQAVAIVPGISRSGATIAAGIGTGLTREAAARFSFLLAIPAIAGAAIVSLPDLSPTIPVSRVVGAAVMAFISGIASIAFLLRFLRSRPMIPLAIYCVAASIVGLVAVAVR
ncbi:MAG: undecaprenyl-diphosphate phosphatase [Actinomycetota bacterium]